jgi:hypothetical protein
MVPEDERREQETGMNCLPQYLMRPISSLTAVDAKNIPIRRSLLRTRNNHAQRDLGIRVGRGQRGGGGGGGDSSVHLIQSRRV